jgi:hypothetical protein
METLTKDKMLDFIYLLVRVVVMQVQVLIIKCSRVIHAIDALPLHLRHNRIIVVIWPKRPTFLQKNMKKTFFEGQGGGAGEGWCEKERI